MVASPTNGMTRFLDKSHRQTYPARSVIISGGEDPKSLYYVEKGSVAVVLKDLDDKECVLSYLYPGDLFGESGLFDQQPQQSLWIVAHVKCTLAEMQYDPFRSLAARYPELWGELSVKMAARLHRANKKVYDLAFLDVKGRVVSALLDLAQMPDAIVHPDGIQFQITRKELARIADCSPGMVRSVLSELEDRGLIHSRGHTTVVYGTR